MRGITVYLCFNDFSRDSGGRKCGIYMHTGESLSRRGTEQSTVDS